MSGDTGASSSSPRGECLDGDDRVCEAELVFWAEWEPPSRVERRWRAAGRQPRVLHRPYWTEPETSGSRQNPDPWVWGDQMIYSNCKQITGLERRPTSMQRLTRGSIICFGSTIDGAFCVDTVFVVASTEPWVPAEAAELAVDEAFKACTGGAITAGGRDAHVSLTLYRGATVENPVEGMFSFVPARRADEDDPRFTRPQIRLPGFINPASRQSTRGSKRPLPMDTLRDTWNALHHQVVAADLLCAVRIQTPERVQDHAPVPRTARQYC